MALSLPTQLLDFDLLVEQGHGGSCVDLPGCESFAACTFLLEDYARHDSATPVPVRATLGAAGATLSAMPAAAQPIKQQPSGHKFMSSDHSMSLHAHALGASSSAPIPIPAAERIMCGDFAGVSGKQLPRTSAASGDSYAQFRSPTQRTGSPTGVAELPGGSQASHSNEIGQVQLQESCTDGTGRAGDGSVSMASGTASHKQLRRKLVASSKTLHHASSVQKRVRKGPRDTIEKLQGVVKAMTCQFAQLELENHKLGQEADVLEQLVRKHDERLTVLSIYGPAVLPADPQRPVSSTRLDVEQVKRMPCEFFVARWQQFVLKVSNAVVLAEGPCPEHAAMSLLHDEVSKMLTLTQLLYLFNPMAMAKARTLNLETGQPGLPSDAHWHTMVSRLQLTDKQARDILACAKNCSRLWNKYKQERMMLVKEMMELTKTRDTSTWSGVSAEEDGLITKLHACLRKEHAAYMALPGFMSLNIASPLQYARAAVYSWPFLPEPNAIVKVLMSKFELRAAS